MSTTFQVRTTTIRDGEESYRVPDVLVGVCDHCDDVVSVPQQSFAAVAEVRKKAEKETLDFRVPRHLLDVLNSSIVELGVEASSDLRSQLFRLFVASVSEKPKIKERLNKNLKSDLLKGSFKRSSRLTIKVSSQLGDLFESMKEASGLNKTQVLDSIIVEVNNDILGKEDKEHRGEVRRALLAMG
ncbi:hypothetical protein D3C87_1222460 [compost metagenome]